MLSSKQNCVSVLISTVCCCHLFAKLMPVIPDIPIPQVQKTVIEGQAGWIFCNVSGSGGSQDDLFTGGDDVGGNAGTIDIQTGINLDEGDGRDGDLVESVTLESGEYYFRHVGIPNGIFKPGCLPLLITVKGHVVIYCQYGFFARIQGDHSQGVPRLEIYAGKPDPIVCQVENRTIGHSEIPFMIVADLNPQNTETPRDGGTFIFHSEYEGDLHVSLSALAGKGKQPGRINVETRQGNVRGIAWAVSIPEDVMKPDPASAGEITIKVGSDGPGPSEILGQFIVSVMQSGILPITNQYGTLVLDADSVTELPLNIYISFEPAPLPGVRKEDLERYLPERALSSGLLVNDMLATGGPGHPGGTIEVKTGMYLDTGTGAHGAVTADRILAAGEYHFEYINDPNDYEIDLTLTVTGDVVILCKYLFAANIQAAEGLSVCPNIEIYTGPPVVPEDDDDPVALVFGLHDFLGAYHFVNVNLTGIMEPENPGPGIPPIPIPGQGGNHINAPGGICRFYTTAFGDITIGHLNASAGIADMFSYDAPGAEGGDIVLLARQGDIEVNSIQAVGGGGLISDGNGGSSMMRGNNVSVYEGVTVNGAGMSGQGGKVYIEALNYVTEEAGRVDCSKGSNLVAINASGAMMGHGGDVTLIPNTLELHEIDVGPEMNRGTVNEWFPDITGILDYE
ncbi:hypothetical protein ACFL5Z_07330 [Planctomycetota bacterium]